MTPFLYISAILFVFLIILWKIEPRSLFNAGIFGLALAFGYLGIVEIAFYRLEADWLYAILILIPFVGFPLIYLIGSVALIWNGRTMARREGISLGHMLAPVVGAIPFLLVAASLIGLVMTAYAQHRLAEWLMLLVSVISAAYLYFLGNAYVTIVYGWLYTAMPKERDPDFVIVHGSGLIAGEVPPLLARRLDKAIEVWRKGGERATIIPSGGQGEDEPRSEACAMSEYLLAHDIPAELIVPEDQSADTDENMRNSQFIIARRGGGKGSKVVFVTNNYHVFRTALISRRVGLKAQGVGCRTARYYLPSAIIREIIAIMVMYKWWHIVPIGGLLALIGLGALLS
ncbi:MAG: YdcF family protein [Thermomicrobiales bacterium]|nr:YdcF family protein [Thermomicrobiales bacterium]